MGVLKWIAGQVHQLGRNFTHSCCNNITTKYNNGLELKPEMDQKGLLSRERTVLLLAVQ